MDRITQLQGISRWSGVAVGAAALLELATLPGCSVAPSPTPDPSAHSWIWPRGSHQPIRREENGCLWRTWQVQDSAVTIIHVRNHHLAGYDSPDAPAAAPFWEAQSQMLQLMEECSTQHPIAALYGDGPTDRFIQSYNQKLAAQSATLGVTKPNDLKALLNGTSESIKAQGALAGFAIRHNMTFHYGENFELAERARAARLAKAPDADDLVLRQREDFLLSRILADFPQGNVTVITSFGADHYLWDNIARWNEAHPGYKFSLIEVSAHKVRELGFELPSQLR